MTPGPGIQRTPLPQGFFASGVNSGVRRYRPDLGLIYSDVSCTAAGVYTRNECQAAPILYSQPLLPSSDIRAVVTNSGQANAATGPEGLIRNQKMVDAVAEAMKCQSHQILSASTGVIGVQLDLEKIIPSVPELVLRANTNAESFATAIMTTDLVPKTVFTEVKLSTGTVRITGICKGSGMIHPNMGTMLGYLLTDAKVNSTLAHQILVRVTDQSFNQVTVDGDTSTNDCVFLLANGMSGVEVSSSQDIEQFEQALRDVSILLAKSIARDGEGATKLIEVSLTGAPEVQMARRAARSLVESPLIKSAVHGEDPNWGRVLARLGANGIPRSCLEKMAFSMQGVEVFRDGRPTSFNKSDLRLLLRSDTVLFTIDLKSGSESALAWGCDLSKKYVEINAEYTT